MICHNGLEIAPEHFMAAVKNLGQCIKCAIQQDSVEEKKGYNLVNSCFISNIMNVEIGKVPAKFVPAAAVTRMGQVLFILTRRKGLLGG